jgi:hypothetical protein
MPTILNWPRYKFHAEARCTFCGEKSLDGHARKTWYDGGGAWEQRCLKCNLITWYDLIPDEPTEFALAHQVDALKGDV